MTQGFLFAIIPLHSAGDLTGTEASGADVHVGGGALHDRLHTLHVRHKGAVGTTMGMGNLDTKGDALTAEFALGHVAYLLAMRIAFQKSIGYIVADVFKKSKNFLKKAKKNYQVIIVPCASEFFRLYYILETIPDIGLEGERSPWPLEIDG